MEARRKCMRRYEILFAICSFLLMVSSVPIIISDESNTVPNNIIPHEFAGNNSIKDSEKIGSYEGPIWPMYQFDQKRTGLSPFNATGNPGRVKRIVETVSIGATLGGLRWILIDEDKNIYCIDYFQNLTCYYSNFSIKWRIQIEGIEKIPVYYNHVLYVMKNYEFFAIDCEKGSILWMKKTNTSSYFFNYSSDDKSIINIIYNKYPYYYISKYFINGTFIEESRIDLPDNNHILNRHFTPAIGLDDSVYMTYENNSDWSYGICAINPNGTLKWINRHDQGWGYPILDDQDKLYYVRDFLSFYHSNGSLGWKIKIGSIGPPSFAPDGNIIVPSGNKIYSIYPNGTLKWEKNYIMGSETLTVDSDGNILFYGQVPNNNNNYIMMLDRNGNFKWKTPISSPFQNPIIMPNGEIYISNRFQDTNKYVLHILGKTKPEIPEINPARSGDSYINFTWFPPDHNGGEEIDEYRIYRKESLGGQFVLFQTVSPDVRWFRDDTVINGNTYYYRITAVSAIGESDPSKMVYATPLSIPSSPRNLEAIFGDNYVYLSWDPSEDDGGTEITKYALYRRIDDKPFKILSNLTSSRRNYNDTDVDPGRTYGYVMTASNLVGESGFSNSISGSPKTLPDPPSDFSIQSGNGFVRLEWSHPPFDGGSPVLNYTLYKGIFSEGILSKLRVFDPDATEYNDTDVENGERYIYKLTVSTSIGTSQTGELSGNPVGPPSPPVNLAAAGNDSYVELSWNEPESNGGLEISGYYLERKSGSDVLLIPIIGKSYVYRDKDVENGRTYSYRIRCFNSAGNSTFTDYVEATPLGIPSAPIELTFQAGRYFSVIFWNTPEDDGGSPLTSFKIFRNGSYLAEVSGSSTTYNDTDVSPGISYSYTVSAVNSVGESIRSESILVSVPELPEIETDIPSAPEDLSYRIENLSVTLTWSEPILDGNSSIMEYFIYRVSDGNEIMVGSVPSSRLSFVDEPLLAGKTYQYHVTAGNGVGEGPPSNVVVVMIEEQNDDRSEDNGSGLIWFILIPAILLLIVLSIVVTVILMRKKEDKNEPPEQEDQGDAYEN